MSALTTPISWFRASRHKRRAAPRQIIRGTSRPALQAHSIVCASVACFDLVALTILLHGIVVAASILVVPLSLQDRLVYTMFGVLAATAVAARRGLYNVGHLFHRRQALLTAVPALCAGVAAITFTVAAGGRGIDVMLWLTAGSLAAGGLVLALTRSISAGLVRYGVRSGGLRYRVAIVGGESYGVVAQLAAHASPFVEIVNVYDGAGPRPEDPIGCFDDLLRQARSERVDAIVLAYADHDTERVHQAFATLRCSVADIFITSPLARCGILPAGHPLAALTLMPIQRRAMTDIDTALKGVIDRLAGMTLLVALTPLLALVALAITLDSPGPVLFRQPRIGYNNAVFSMYKFRSMYAHAADRLARRQTTRDDPRVTRVGRVIRRLSLDELPQLLNVIRGEMSLVGPRPHAPGTNIEGLLLEHVAAGYPLRHRVLPGITGWAQINGSRGILSSPEQIKQRVQLDLEYIDRWSLALDFKIICLTALREIWSRRAY